MPRPATLAALTTATDAAGGVLVLDAVLDCAFVTGLRRSGPTRPRSASAGLCRPRGGAVAVRPCQATPLARPQHQQRHRTGHLPC